MNEPQVTANQPKRGPRAHPDPGVSRGKEAPHSLELERTVLSVLLDGGHATAIHTVRQHIQHPLVFYARDHRIIFQACLDLDDQGQRIDTQSVAELLRRSEFQAVLDRLRQQQLLLDSGQLDSLSRAQWRALYRLREEDEDRDFQDSALAALGGYAGLAEISSLYTTAAGLERNAQILLDDYLKRRLIAQLGRIADNAHRTTDDFGALIDQSSQYILELSRHGGVGQVHDMVSAVDDTIAAIVERNANPNEGVLTGFDQLDDMLMSLRPGGLYVLAARPGVGKTSFALSLVQNICGSSAAEGSALFFSLEVDRIDLIKKLLCGKANIDFKALERGLIDEAEFQHLEQAAEDIKAWQLDLMDVSDLTIQGMRSVVKRHTLERGSLKLVVIDYLQLLGAARGDISEYEKISEISRTLKIIAREMGVPVLALSQMSRESERSATKPREPRLSDLRGSGSIEQDADAVLFLHRVNPEDDQSGTDGRDVKLIVAKNRFGPMGFMSMKFFPARQRFAAVAKDEYAGGRGTQVTGGGEKFAVEPGEDEDLFR